MKLLGLGLSTALLGAFARTPALVHTSNPRSKPNEGIRGRVSKVALIDELVKSLPSHIRYAPWAPAKPNKVSQAKRRKYTRQGRK